LLKISADEQIISFKCNFNGSTYKIYLLDSCPTDCGETDVKLLNNGGIQTVEIQQQNVLVVETYKSENINTVCVCKGHRDFATNQL
jgi:hypothetical protein